MRRKKKLVSDSYKFEIAQELGLGSKVSAEGWSSLTTEEIGRVVRRMIEKGMQ